MDFDVFDFLGFLSGAPSHPQAVSKSERVVSNIFPLSNSFSKYL